MAYLSVVFHKSLNWRGLNQILLWKFNVAQPHRILDCLAWGGKACGTTAHKQAQQLNSCYWREWGSCISALTAARKASLFLNYPCDLCKIPSPGKETATSKGSGQTQPLSIKFSSPAPPHFTFQSKQNNQKCKLQVDKPKVPTASMGYHSLLIWSRNSLLQLAFNIHVLSAWLATLNTLKPYHVLSQEHTTTKCFNRPTLSFSQCSLIIQAALSTFTLTGNITFPATFPVVIVE